MDMNSIATGEIVAKHIDAERIRQRLSDRFSVLASQLPADAASQFMQDSQAIECQVSGNGQTVSFGLKPSESYLIKYLESHSTPVSGGSGGMVHELDGSVRQSLVDPDLWGTELPWLELPILDCKNEAEQFLQIIAPEEVQASIASSKNEIAQAAVPVVTKQIQQLFGGDA